MLEVFFFLFSQAATGRELPCNIRLDILWCIRCGSRTPDEKCIAILNDAYLERIDRNLNGDCERLNEEWAMQATIVCWKLRMNYVLRFYGFASVMTQAK